MLILDSLKALFIIECLVLGIYLK